MPDTTFADREVASLVRLGLYQNREEVIADAVRDLLLNNRSLRLELALDLFKTMRFRWAAQRKWQGLTAGSSRKR